MGNPLDGKGLKTATTTLATAPQINDQSLDNAIYYQNLLSYQKFGFIKRVDKGCTTIVKDLES